MTEFLLGLDYGTGSAKACIINNRADIISHAIEEYPILTERPLWSEHDPRLYWEITCRLVRLCISKAGIDPRTIRAVANSSALPNLVMVDKQHNPVNNAYNLMDRRARPQVERIKKEIGEDRIFEITKNRLDDHPILVNLMWEKENRPDDFKKIDKALTIDGYISLKLTGKAAMHYSAGAFYGVAYDLLNREFNSDILAAIGISKDLIPEAFPCTEIIGALTPEAANETGLAEGTPVAAGQVDCNAGWIGGGATEEGDIQMNLGTCGNFGIIHKKKTFMRSMIAFAHTVDSVNTYITVPTTTTGGQLLRYLRDTLSPIETETEKLTGLSAYRQFDMEAEATPPGNDGLLMLPYLMGERTPIWDVDARGVFFGLSLNHHKGHFIRAMMEGTAYALYDSLRLINAEGLHHNSPLVLNEGGAQSAIWRKIITDVFNVPTVMVKNRVGAPYGDAILAGVACGMFSDFGIARKKAQYIEALEPDKKRHELYMEYFGLYKDIYEHIKDDFRTLSKLREKWRQ